MPAATTTTTLDVYSDVACPWCFIGKRRLERALGEEPAGSVLLRWRPFELQPDLPPEGVDARPFFAAKFGGERAVDEAFARVAEVGRGEGIAFDFEAMRRAPNTRLAHRLIWLAGERGQADPVVEALFRGHFEEGVHVGDLDACLRLLAAHRVPLDLEELRMAAARREGRAEVEAAEAEAAALGIRAVPFFVAGDRYAVSGAQPPAAYRQLLAAARDDAAPA